MEHDVRFAVEIRGVKIELYTRSYCLQYLCVYSDRELSVSAKNSAGSLNWKLTVILS